METESTDRELVDAVRKFVELKVSEMSKDEYDMRDVERLRDNEIYVKRFLQSRDNDVEETTTMILETLMFRKRFEVNDIKENCFPSELFQVGIMYDHNVDREGNVILIFHVKLHDKGAVDEKMQQKFVLFWIETLFWSRFHVTPHKITILFDMTSTGYSNMDLGLMRFIVNCFKLYYPNFLAYFLVYEMSFIFNAVWEIIKGWLPDKSRDKVKFIKKSTIKEFISENQLLKQLGGSDDFVYSTKNTTLNEEILNDQNETTEIISKKEKVHFIDGHSDGVKSELNINNDDFSPLSLNPSDVITFNGLTSQLNLTNEVRDEIKYKIKTTSPEKYKVKPVSGVMLRGSSMSVIITLMPGYDVSVRDKFLVQCSSTEDSDRQHIYRLRCKTTGSSSSMSLPLVKGDESVTSLLLNVQSSQQKIMMKIDKIERNVRYIFGLLILCSSLLIIHSGFLW